MRKALAGVMLGGLTCLGLLLRWQYAVSTSPFWDEFITLWGARNVIEGLVSPFQWGVGADAPLFRDLQALFLRLLGLDATVARALGIVISVITIPVTFYVGKRMFSVPAGLFASALMTFVPQLVIEGARARPYALFLLLVVLSALFFYRWMIETDEGDQVSRRASWPFVVCFVGAVFAHLEAILLLPGFALSALARWGRRIWVRRQVLRAFVVCGACAGLALMLFLANENVPGAIPLGDTVWAGSAQIDLGVKNVEAFAKLFRRTPGGFVLLSIATGGMAYSMAWALWKKLGTRASRPDPARGEKEGTVPLSASSLELQDRGLVYLSMLLLWGAGAIVFLLGPRWGSEIRYILFLFPVFSLVVGATVVGFLSFLVERVRIAGEETQQWVVFGLVAVGIGLIGVPSIADRQRFQQEWGYELAFEYVANRWREGDVTVTVAPMACLVTLEQCDYTAIQRAYETYAVEVNGRLVEAVTKLPLILTVEQMQQVLDEHERVWFVTDEGRLLSRYDPAFAQLIWDRMELVANERGGLVFLSSQQRELAVRREMEFAFEEKFKLLGCEMSGRNFIPGDTIELTLHWRGLNRASYFGTDYSVFVHLVDTDGQVWGQADGYPVGGLYSTSHWRSTEVVIPDRRQIMLPLNIPEGRYRLEAGMYLLSSGERLEVWDESGAPGGDSVILSYAMVGEGHVDRSVPDNPLRINLGDEVDLMGYDLLPNTLERGGSLIVTLYWRAPTEIRRDFTVFVHLVGQGGRIVAQHDGQPEHGFYPTSYWEHGEVVKDEHVLQLPSGLPGGRYELRAGMYLPADMRRLSVVGGEADRDWVVLTTTSVGEP